MTDGQKTKEAPSGPDSATGRSQSEVEIISADVCPFAQRSRIVLLEKKVDFTLSEIDLENKPDWFDRVSPYGKVPVLRHGETHLYESAIINEYLDEAFPLPPLMPGDPAGRAQARIWINFCDSRFTVTFYKLLLEQDQDKQNEYRERMLDHLRFLETEALAGTPSSGPYWMGKGFSLVDASLAPFFERFVALEHYRDVVIPPQHISLHAWIAALRERESVKKTSHSRDYFIARYAKYASGAADGVTAKEIREES
jgi:glutathione S-transferase